MNQRLHLEIHTEYTGRLDKLERSINVCYYFIIHSPRNHIMFTSFKNMKVDSFREREREKIVRRRRDKHYLCTLFVFMQTMKSFPKKAAHYSLGFW